MPSDSRLPTLEGERLRLRWLTEADTDALFGIFSDPEVMRYWISLPFSGKTEAEQLVREIHELFPAGSLYEWGVALRETNEVIGTATLAYIDRDNGRAEIGYAIARPHWRRGYASEAIRVLLRYAFGEMNLRRIEADVDPRNEASIRTLERIGFKREGLLRERWNVGGEVQDALFLGLLRSEWSG
jgi:[ribosomal protein S5]-alanine N-acetyltransferase